jgi:hypothetical protein
MSAPETFSCERRRVEFMKERRGAEGVLLKKR